jgi:hypothetical protein
MCQIVDVSRENVLQMAEELAQRELRTTADDAWHCWPEIMRGLGYALYHPHA